MATIDRIMLTIGQMDKRVQAVEIRLNHVESSIEELTGKIEKLSQKVDSNFKWTIAVIITGGLVPIWLSLLLTILKVMAVI